MIQILAESDNGDGDNGGNWPFCCSPTSDDIDDNGDDDNYDYDYDDEPLWLLSK